MKEKTKKIVFRAFVISLILVGVLVFVFYWQAEKATPPELVCKDCNVILITMTGLRYDHMSSNGYFRNTTPNLDKFAKESIVFDNAFSHGNFTAPARVSLYTSLYPFQHGFMRIRYDMDSLPQEIPTFFDVFNKAGYTNVGFIGDGYLADRFDEYSACIPAKDVPYQRVSQRYSGPIVLREFSCTIPRALAWLKKNSSSKFFLHVQGHDLHCPFSQRGGITYDPDYQGDVDFRYCLKMFESREPQVINGEKHYLVNLAKEPVPEEVLISERDLYHLIALYDESIIFADRQVGMFLEEIRKLGLYDNTIVIFTSEHGDMLSKYGRFTKLGSYYDDVIHSPLVMHIPNVDPMRLDGLVSHIDIPQTMLDFLGLERLEGDGRSLAPLILRGEAIRGEVFAGTTLVPTAFNLFLPEKSYTAVVRTKDWKLIYQTTTGEDSISSNSVELFNIARDKEELNNLADKRLDVLQDMQSRLDKWLRLVK